MICVAEIAWVWDGAHLSRRIVHIRGVRGPGSKAARQDEDGRAGRRDTSVGVGVSVSVSVNMGVGVGVGRHLSR